jgi:hypothetical protein
MIIFLFYQTLVIERSLLDSNQKYESQKFGGVREKKNKESKNQDNLYNNKNSMNNTFHNSWLLVSLLPTIFSLDN